MKTPHTFIKNVFSMSKAIPVVAVSLLTTLDVAADEETSPSKKLFEVVRAKPLERAQPTFPFGPSRRKQEGWVRFTYVITEEGKVIDPVVVDSSGEPAFEIEAMKAIKTWQFEPAKQDGKPIQQCEQEVQFNFNLKGASDGVRRPFNSRYKKAQEALRNDDLELANQIVDEMREKKIWNMYENAWFWMLKSRVYALEGNEPKELSSLYRANNSDDSKKFLGDENYSFNLGRIFVLELKAQKFARAHKTFLTLKEQSNASEQIAKLQTYFDRLDGLLSSDEALVQQATINERGIKNHQLYRSSFAIGEINGEIDMLDIRCDNKRTKFTAAEDTYWSIPTSWGTCTVLFEGDENTTFSIIEVDEVATDKEVKKS